MTGTDDGRDPASQRRPHGADLDALTALAELGHIDLAATDLIGVLARVAHLARSSVARVAAASVTLLSSGVAGTAAYTGDLALALDERQYDAGYGPCLAAAADQSVNLIRDMASEERWPAFAAAAHGRGVLSSLSIGIPFGETVTGALNLYALELDAFDEAAIGVGKAFARYAAVPLANAHRYVASVALAAQMSDAMASRAVIEQAKGVIMAQQRVSPEDAFGVLSRSSQLANRKLREIAQSVVDSAQNAT